MARLRPAIALALVLAVLPPAAALAEPAVGQYVDLAPVGLPVVVDGRVVNYVFVSVRVNLTSGANGPRLQSREPYFRDALVRAGHRTPFTRYDDYTRLDEAKLKATMLTLAQAIAPGDVTSIGFTSPSQPKQRTGLPSPRIPPRR
ncbi:MAG TPA: hypothetical protein VG939_01475 [Caulobacteraceae bacterium]|nr:hypothetical protein [Caulobacteraceae bacterium]